MQRGVKSAYTDEMADAIAAHVRKGVPEVIAAQAAGISITTLQRWKKQNEYFRDALKKARAEAIMERVESIRKSAEGGIEYETTEKVIKKKDGTIEKISIKKKTAPQWTPHAWWLERQECEQFGLNRVELKELLQLLRTAKKERAEIIGNENGSRERTAKS